MKPATDRMGVLGREIEAAGGPPSAEQMAEMQRLERKLRIGGRLTALLLGMSVARYVSF